MQRNVFIALALLLPALSSGDSITYEVYVLESCGRTLIAKGTREYSLEDVRTSCKQDKGGQPHCQKALALAKGFGIGISIHPSPTRTGLGLWVEQKENRAGFSWDWFSPEGGNTFVKLKGTGRIQTEVNKESKLFEVTSVEFLDDIVLRYQQNIYVTEPGEHSHEVVVFRGSVLRVPPMTSEPAKEQGS